MSQNHRRLKPSFSVNKLSPRHQIIVLFVGLFIFVLGVNFYLGVKSGRIGNRAAEPNQPTVITNQATVDYCTEGDAATECDPASNKFTGSAQSNTVTTTIQDPGACVKFSLEKAGTTPRVFVSIRQNGQEIAKTRASYDGTGINITASEFISKLNSDPATTYDIYIKPDRHVAKKVTGNPLAACLQGSGSFLWGDLSGKVLADSPEEVEGDNEYKPADIVRVIQLRVQNPNNVSPGDIVKVIQRYVNNIKGEQL